MKKILIMVNRDFVLYNFRIELVRELLQSGAKVYICLPYGGRVDEMVDMGCTFIDVDIDKRGKNPFKDAVLISRYIGIFSKIKPDMALLYTTKVCIYGGIISGAMRIPYIVNISGLGTAVENKSLIQPFVLWLYRLAIKKAKCVFFQNIQNQVFFEKHRLYNGRQRLTAGSGVNLDRWRLMEYPSDSGGVEFLFMARVIKEKGIEEYLAAAEQIKKEFPSAVFHVLGPCDGGYGEALADYEAQGIIKYHGMVKDTRLYIAKAHCTIHPSYYPEGMSNVCLESAACGRPVITTDRSGCRETVDDNITGYIFEAKNTDALICRIWQFLSLTNDERRQMGLCARAKMEREFDRCKVTSAYLEEING